MSEIRKRTLNLQSHLYSTLLPLSLNADIEFSHKMPRLPDPRLAANGPGNGSSSSSRVNVATQIEMAIRALSFRHNSTANGGRTANVSRMATFTKRLMLASLHVPEKSTLACAGVVNKRARKITANWPASFRPRTASATVST